MIDALLSILCVLKNLLLAVMWAGALVINALVVALGAFASAVIALLPDLPAVPDPPSPTALGWIAWFFPVTTVLAAFTAMLVTYGVFLLVRIGLRWAKAI